MSPSKTAIQVDGVRLTSPDRVLFKKQGITKRELAEYYRGIAEWVLPHLHGRPLTMLRCPQGQGAECFVQRRASAGFPEAVQRVEIPDEDGTASYVAVTDLQGLISLVQYGVLELHTWGARSDRLDRPDRLVLDLDPDTDLPFVRVVEAALEMRGLLEELGLRSFVKTSGGKGLHVVAPLARRSSWDEVRQFTRSIAEGLETRYPDRYLAASSKAERKGKIFIDWLRNGWSASVVAAYSTRARPGAPVSTPLAWEELDRPFEPGSFDLRTVPVRLAGLRRDPWEEYFTVRQGLTRETRTAVGSIIKG